MRYYYNRTWTDHGFTYNDCALQEKEWLTRYPSMRKVSDHNPAYNCHSYAWYSTSTSNKYWIPDPDIYISDGSFTRQSTAKAGYKAYWSGVHSAIVRSVSGNTITCISKWGAMGVYTHELNDCPYSEEYRGTIRYYA